MDTTFDLPGWTTAVDPRSGRQYFINLLEKTTTWEDPRIKYKHVYGPSIPMQTLHGSPKNVQVYPTQSYPTQAFQSHPGQSVHASPVPSTKASQYTAHTTHTTHTVEMSSLSRSSPHTPRVGNLIKHQQMLQQQQQQQYSHIQETSFTTPTPMETEATVSKINSMFPTASEHHIRLLLKKYLKSMFPKCEETVILDVLATVDNNVQKASEQLLKMGFEKKEITPAPRLSHRKKEDGSVKKQQQFAAEPTPPPKQKTFEEKKKLKAKLQSQYKDTIPERVVSMALESVDYSEEKALKILEIVIQEDKDSKQKSDKKKGDGVEKNVSFKEPSFKNSKSVDLDKAAAIENDETMIINSDHTIITTPIESPQTDIVDSSKSRASTGKLQIPSTSHHSEFDETPSDGSSEAIISVDKSKKRHKARSDSARSQKSDKYKAIETANKENTKESTKSILNKSIVFEENKDGNFISIVTKSNVQGPNHSLAKGPRDDLLLTDYVAWNGANPDIIRGTKIKAQGSNPLLRSDRTYTPLGSSSSKLCKGPQSSLAIGSIYAQTNRPANVACN